MACCTDGIHKSFEKDVPHEMAGLGVLAIMSRNARGVQPHAQFLFKELFTALGNKELALLKPGLVCFPELAFLSRCVLLCLGSFPVFFCVCG